MAGGSSPHTRGARPPPEKRPGLARIIPAYAGSTPRPMGLTISRWDHPRIRGEHDGVYVVLSDAAGSSPHTRGALEHGEVYQRRPGIIPAYAGSTAMNVWKACFSPDHPRIRGEHSPRLSESILVVGSSPHTRGAPGFGAVVDPERGIIPAYAGSTRRRGCRRRRRADHPRIRGEHCAAEIDFAVVQGSSPHTRGARRPSARGLDRRRIIPAYAGSTEANSLDGQTMAGSSPHTRGALGLRLHDVRLVQDHPRIRGEHGRRRRGR